MAKAEPKISTYMNLPTRYRQALQTIADRKHDGVLVDAVIEAIELLARENNVPLVADGQPEPRHEAQQE